LKALPKIFAHADKAVRAEGTNLTQVLYQWIGPGIEPWLGDLKPVQVKELKDAFEGLEKDGKGHKSLKQERLTRAGQREAEAAAAAGEDGEAPAEVEQGASALLSFSEALLIETKRKKHPLILGHLQNQKTSSPSFQTASTRISNHPSGKNEKKPSMILRPSLTIQPESRKRGRLASSPDLLQLVWPKMRISTVSLSLPTAWTGLPRV